MTELDRPIPHEDFLELMADHLLRTAPGDPERPVYTELQLSRRWKRVVSIEALAQRSACTPQSMRDELRFLLSMARLEPEFRRCLKLWIDGWNQQEIAAAFNVPQQTVSYRLRKALKVCYDAAPLSFRRFSQHTIYRKVRRLRRLSILRKCLQCGEEYPLGIGYGRYCSSGCGETAKRASKSVK
jgi:hypothetical protein